MRRPCADREEKQVTHGRDMRNEERLDPGNPNQRRLSEQRVRIDEDPDEANLRAVR
jgi:hypothetical protein